MWTLSSMGEKSEMRYKARKRHASLCIFEILYNSLKNWFEVSKTEGSKSSEQALPKFLMRDENSLLLGL